MIKDLNFLTLKPILYVCNVSIKDLNFGNSYTDKIHQIVSNENSEMLTLAVSLEAEIFEIEDFYDRQSFLNEYQIKQPASLSLINKAYKLLNMQTFFTVGEKEVKAWTIQIGWNAQKAAGVIHSDFEKGFIRSEVISYVDYLKYESEARIKEAGKLRVEGKEYIVRDGDIMHLGLMFELFIYKIYYFIQFIIFIYLKTPLYFLFHVVCLLAYLLVFVFILSIVFL